MPSEMKNFAFLNLSCIEKNFFDGDPKWNEICGLLTCSTRLMTRRMLRPASFFKSSSVHMGFLLWANFSMRFGYFETSSKPSGVLGETTKDDDRTCNYSRKRRRAEDRKRRETFSQGHSVVVAADAHVVHPRHLPDVIYVLCRKRKSDLHDSNA